MFTHIISCSFAKKKIPSFLFHHIHIQFVLYALVNNFLLETEQESAFERGSIELL